MHSLSAHKRQHKEDISAPAHNKSVGHHGGYDKTCAGERDMLADAPEKSNVFYASDLSENFVNMIDHILEGESDDARIRFLNFDVENGEEHI